MNFDELLPKPVSRRIRAEQTACDYPTPPLTREELRAMTLAASTLPIVKEALLRSGCRNPAFAANVPNAWDDDATLDPAVPTLYDRIQDGFRADVDGMLFGMPVRTDAELPPTALELRSPDDGTVIARYNNVAPAPPPEDDGGPQS